MKKKMILFLLPQLIMATTIGTNVRMERLKPFAEISIQPHKNLAFNTKISYNSFEQNIEAKYKLNEYVELTGEAFVGYENIKEYKESDKLKKAEENKKKLEEAKKEIEKTDDISKVIETARELKDETDIQNLVKDKVTRKDAYKKLQTVIDKNLKTTQEDLDKAINSKNMKDEIDNIEKVMNYIGGPSGTSKYTNAKEGIEALKKSYNEKTGKIDNAKLKIAFEKFGAVFSNDRRYDTIKGDFDKVSKLYEQGDQGLKTLKNEIKDSVENAITTATESINKFKGEIATKHHIYYGAGVGANLNYNDFELRVKGRLGASTYIVKVDADLNTETTLYWSIESAIRYNIKVNKFTIYPEIGMKYIGAKYGQKGFIPYGSIGLNYTF